MAYCMYCGNTGLKPNGSVCDHCKTQPSVTELVDLSSLNIPMAYRGSMFSEGLLPSGISGNYVGYMSKLFKDITTLKPMCVNIFLNSPPQSGKTVFAYSCIEILYRKKEEVFPLFDVSELECIIREIDRGKKPQYLNDDTKAISLYESKFLFVKVPEKLEFSTTETMAQLIDRRVRRGNSTIFISNKTWEDVTFMDKSGVLKNMVGDGSFRSIAVKSFWKEKE